MPDETRPYGGGQPIEATGRGDLGRARTEAAQPALAPTVAAISTERALDATVAASPVPLSRPAGLELAPGTRVGEYRVGRKLGEGGMGAVYAGEQPTIGKRVAIKVLAPHCAGEPELVRRFVEEARAANLIHHPHIIDIFSFGQLPDGRHYFVMEFLDGESMAEAIDGGSLQPAELGRLLCQICGALEASHQAGIVHRDLKPENIWIARPPHGESYVKLLDFGIAKLLDPTHTNLTQTGAVMGTPLFMSPEQCLGRPVDARTDVYALGVLLYRLFTGRYPFAGTVITELVFKHVTEAPPPPSSFRPLPPELEHIILDCLAKDPSLRPASARVLGDRLAAVLSAAPALGMVTAVPVSAQASLTAPVVPGNLSLQGERTRPLGRRSSRNWLWLGVGLAATALAAGGWLLWRGPAALPAARPAEPSQTVRITEPAVAGLAKTVAQPVPTEHAVAEAAVREAEEKHAPVARGGSRPHAPSAARSGGKPTPLPAGAVEQPVSVKPAGDHAAPVEARRKPVPEEAAPPAPRPTRAQERGLLDENPLRR